LASAIGARRAAQMQLSGERISAETAYQWGLTSEIVPASHILYRCLELANSMAALDPVKRQLFVSLNRRIADQRLESALAIELVEIERGVVTKRASVKQATLNAEPRPKGAGMRFELLARAAGEGLAHRVETIGPSLPMGTPDRGHRMGRGDEPGGLA
jgi:hypothetical protein